MAKVTLKGVQKVYEGGVKAVDDFNLDIKDKEFVVLVGPSGCGKSTTLRMVAGLEEITGGELHIGERLINDVPAKDRDIAMVFQNYALYPHMTVRENMEFGLKLRRYPKDEINRRVREAAEILGIEELLERKPRALSGGQRQRVALGRAIVRKPKVFLFDEPLSNLDAKLRVQMRAEISKLHVRLQTTVIYVTHDQVEAMTMGDRIVVMRDGYIQQCSTPMSLYKDPVNKFVAGFIGTPPMNFIEVDVTKEGGNYFLSDGAFKLKVPSERDGALAPYLEKSGKSRLVFGIRPEEIFDEKSYSGTEDGNSLKTPIEVVEPMGALTIIYANTGKNTLTCQFDSTSEAYDNTSVNKEIKLFVNMNEAHFFDIESEQNIVDFLGLERTKR